MKKLFFGKYLVVFSVLSFFPSLVSASNIYFETAKNPVYAGDTFILEVKMDSKEASINSIEGDVEIDSIDNNFVVNDFSLSKSIFTLWPQTPSLSEDGRTVSFVGGVPEGFNSNGVTLFNIVIETNKEGNINISPKNIAVYANDGKGSRVPVDVQSLTVNVFPRNEGVAPTNEWVSLVTADKTRPENFSIEIGKDNSLFDGKRFAFFTAVDNQSGISFYEVSEDGNPAVRSGSMYVLSNQDDSVTPNLVVTAYDKAGNKTTAIYKTPGFAIFGVSLNYFFVVLAVIFIIFVFFRIIKRNKKHVRTNQQV